MKYRSFNEQLLIATALLINVFNDIVIDRRKHGYRDYSKPISLRQIAQQEIQIPCILGQRGHILRSLQNQSGKYKLPLIILTNKGLKTDVPRMVDLHNDVFYQQDEAFSKLNPEDPLYKPQQIGKRRAQPIIMDFEMTIISKYKEDIDQILSNWAVFFRPDIYVKWFSPRIINAIITSQITWSHQIGYNLPIEFNPTNVFSYTATTSFSFKTWLFPGMNVQEGKIDQDTQSIIKKFKFFPNRGTWYDDQDVWTDEKDTNDQDSSWSFGNIYMDQQKLVQDVYDADDLYSIESIQTTNIGQMGMWGVQSWQQFEGTSGELMKNGKYAVNNVFSQNHPQISGDPIISNIKNNPLVGDFFSNKDKYLINDWKNYQGYLLMQRIENNSKSVINDVFFKSGLDSDGNVISTNILFPDLNLINRKLDFGTSKYYMSDVNINYDINSKKFQIKSQINNDGFYYFTSSVHSLENGIQQTVILQNKYGSDQTTRIRFKFYRHINKKLEIVQEQSLNKTKNIILFNKLIPNHDVRFLIQQQDYLKNASKLINMFNIYNSAMNLKQIYKNQEGTNFYQVYFENMDVLKVLKQFGLSDKKLLIFKLYFQKQIDEYNYQMYLNNAMYFIVKSHIKNSQDCEMYDYGVISNVSFVVDHAPLFQIAVKNAKMLLGFNINMSI